VCQRVHSRIMSSSLRQKLRTWGPLLIAVAAVVWQLRAFLVIHTLPARGDPTLSFQGSDLTPNGAPWLRVAINAVWHEGQLAFWNPFTNAGAPQFEAPEASALSLATFLGGFVPVEAAVKWGAVAHVVVGMLGVFAMARRLHIAAMFAAVGAFAFGIGTYLLDHFRAGHLSYVEPMCLAPWAMFFLWAAVSSRSLWWRYAVGVGVVTGLQVLEGGSSVVLYTVFVFFLLIFTSIGLGFLPRILNIGRVGLVSAVCFVMTAAPKMLPMLAYLELTGRGGGLSLEQSSVGISEVAHPLPSVMAVAVMCVGLGWFLVKGPSRAGLWLALSVLLGIGAATMSPIYEFLWLYIPGFRYQRIPERALVMVALSGPLLLASGMEGIWQLLRARAWGVGLFAILFIAFVNEAWSIAPDTPPMADPRVEREANHAMRWLADHASGSRVHIWESPDRHWGADNITVPLGLEAITSYTPSEHRDYLPGDFDQAGHRTFLGESYLHPARLWGLLNVRYVLSTAIRSVPGLGLELEVERCPLEVCQPGKSSGPYIYENEYWLPRGWVASRAIGFVGPERPVFEAVLDVLRMPQFDPVTTVLLHLTPNDIVPPVDGLFAVGDEVRNVVSWGSPEAKQLLLRLLEQEPLDLQPATFSRHDNNHLEFGATANGWLVASEKLALYPGWSGNVGGVPVDIVRANGVLGAIRVGDGDVVRFSYEPRYFRIGVGLLVVMVLSVTAVEFYYRFSRGDRRLASSLSVHDRTFGGFEKVHPTREETG